MLKTSPDIPHFSPFCPGFCLKSLSFLSFSERCKNQGSFYKGLIINKNAILRLTGRMGEDMKIVDGGFGNQIFSPQFCQEISGRINSSVDVLSRNKV